MDGECYHESSWARIRSRPRADRAHDSFTREFMGIHAYDPARWACTSSRDETRTWPIKARRLSFHGGRNVPVARDLALRSEAEYIRGTIRRVPLANRSPSYKYREGIKLIKVNTLYLGLLSMTGGSLHTLWARPRRITILIFAKEEKRNVWVMGLFVQSGKTLRVHSLT